MFAGNRKKPFNSMSREEEKLVSTVTEGYLPNGEKNCMVMFSLRSRINHFLLLVTTVSSGPRPNIVFILCDDVGWK